MRETDQQITDVMRKRERVSGQTAEQADRQAATTQIHTARGSQKSVV